MKDSTKLALIAAALGGGSGALMPAKDWKRRVANAFAGLMIGGGSGYSVGTLADHANGLFGIYRDEARDRRRTNEAIRRNSSAQEEYYENKNMERRRTERDRGR